MTATLLVCASLGAQTTHRDSVLADARYLKSIFRTDDAIEKLSALVQPGAMDEGVLAELADCHFQSGAYEDAAGTYFLLSSKDPDNTTIAPLQGLAYYRKGDYETAGKVFQRQEDIGNDTYPIHYYLGQSYWHTLVIYRAEEELLKAWQIDSSDVSLLYAIAAVKLEAFRPFERDVQPWLDKALEMLEPDHAMLSRIHQQYGLGYYRKTDSWDQAIAWYEKYMKEAKPGSRGYEFAADNVKYLRSELFMEEP